MLFTFEFNHVILSFLSIPMHSYHRVGLVAVWYNDDIDKHSAIFLISPSYLYNHK